MIFMRKFIVLALALCFAFAANAQIGNLIKNKINQKVEEGVNKAVDKAVDNAIDKTFDNTKKAIEKEKNDNSSTIQDDPHDNGGWTCPACGATGNHGNFCKECAAKKPGASSATETNTASESGWTCPACGHTGNQGKFCNECGAKKPEATAADDSWTCPQCGHKGNKGKFCDECGAKRADGANANMKASSEWNKFDFVPGDECFYYDQLVGEQLGEFPSMWDLVEGECEIAKVNGENVIAMYQNCWIKPLMEVDNYLGETFTIEFDYYDFYETEGQDYGYLQVRLCKSGDRWIGSDILNFGFYNHVTEWAYTHDDRKRGFSCSWGKIDGDRASTEQNVENFGYNKWHHVSMSVNRRAVKIYVDEKRVVNIPNYKREDGWLGIGYNSAGKEYPAYIRNVRIAKGAVPLYDRMMTDGKFITYGITFDVGKSVIKPESMGEINRIVQLMNDNPELKFEVQGHTDNTGNAASNQTLSEARAKAIVDKLVELGISADRLTSVGKGQTSPIADNSTEEGKAKNRRVEFVKK